MSKRRGLIMGAAHFSWCAPRLFLAFAALTIFAAQAKAQSLGSAENFAVLGASTVTNGGAYTAVVAGKDGGIGGVVLEMYHLP